DTTQTIVLTQGQIVIKVGQNLTIQAAKNTTATVSGGFTSRIFEVDASVTLNDLDLINGNVSGVADGGAVLDFVGNLTVNNCSFSGTSVVARGGVTADAGGNLKVNNCPFPDNTANGTAPYTGLGGAIAAYPSGANISTAYPTVSINNSTFSGNTATDGGAIYDSGLSTSFKNPQMAISGCSFSGNSATNGGAVYLDPSDTEHVTISNSSFVNNTAT